MTSEQIYRELGGVDPALVAQAAPGEKITKKRRKWIKWVAAAACLTLMAAGGILWRWQQSPEMPVETGDPVTSYFTITAMAADGEMTELGVHSSCFNSGTAKENIFGVDMPLFNFEVRPTDLKNNEVLYQRFDIAVSYNGKLAQGKDEHVMVGFVGYRDGPVAWAYFVSGWFTEPTELLIQIIDKESRQIVETIAVMVTYHAERQGYDLEITNLTTLFGDQKQAVEAQNWLMTYFFVQGYVTEYPDWFGGCYIEDGLLYVKLVSPSEEVRETLSRRLDHYKDVVVFLDEELSLSVLQDYADRGAEELMDLGCEVTSWYVDSVDGQIVITVLGKDHAAATAWAEAASREGVQIKIEIGGYISPDVGEVIEFRAEPFLQDCSLSWVYGMDVRIENGQYYLNDILYDKVTYVEDFVPDYGTGLSSMYYQEEKYIEVLAQINSQKGCYLLETESEKSYGTLAMYVIGDTYYFFRFFENGTVMRIHAGTVSE